MFYSFSENKIKIVMTQNKKKEFFRVLKYFMFASSAGLIEMGVFTLLDKTTSWAYWPSYLIALVLSVIWNFTLNRKFTFKSNNNVPIAMVKVFVYYLIFTPVSTWFGNYLAETLYWNPYIVTALNIALNGVTEFLYQRYFVFGKTIDSTVDVPKGAV